MVAASAVVVGSSWVAADCATQGSVGRALVADREVVAQPAVDTTVAVGRTCLVVVVACIAIDCRH